ncbi:adenylyl-sulfate kinase [Zoogloea sp. LCSB751]|uniref:adenylyl-sulfate kinase n=1 Tax=Zoogloea sp. LCSB751 TaxID=1965277 RepID=UPI0009A485CE|nr:adenylyl-sulfate kinase [Zoogloea sp. LCSB751]
MAASPQIYWITGLPAAGKTTLAQALATALRNKGRRAFVLDGDELRKGLCADLGLSDADRSENIRRASEVARLMWSAGLDVVCAFVSPFQLDRQQARNRVPPGRFIEIHLSTPLEECMRRDPKGLYARAQAGEIHGLTGLDGPYEPPEAPEFRFDTRNLDTAEIALQVVNHLDNI